MKKWLGVPMNVRNFYFPCLFVFLLACEQSPDSGSTSFDGGVDAGVTVDAPLVHAPMAHQP